MYGFEHAAYMRHGLGLLGGLLGLLFWVAVIVIAVVFIVKMTRHARTAHAPQGTALAPMIPATATGISAAEDQALRIARERLARGDIDPEQYRTIVETLST
jgi:uncharacterized membrane protein